MPSRTEGDRVIYRPFDRSDIPSLLTWLIIVVITIHGLVKMAMR